jgi:hypothetical protein
MRGGITSGIVYPRAVAKLAKTYNFARSAAPRLAPSQPPRRRHPQFGANNGDDRFQTIYELPKKLPS